MLEVRTEPPLTADEHIRLASVVEALNQFQNNPFGMMFGGAGMLIDAVTLARKAGAERIILDLFPADPGYDMLASMAGFQLSRVLLQLRRPLPLPAPAAAVPPAAFTTRAFRPGTRDESDWLEVNNRAFAWHPEQANWTLDDLHRRMAEPWFEPEGFRLHERQGRLAAFCWTKIHHDETPAAGEIFVIGVDPDFQGQGLGEPMTAAGLDWLSGRGLTRALLYTESDNRAALRIYQRMGFHVATTHRWYEQALR